MPNRFHLPLVCAIATMTMVLGAVSFSIRPGPAPVVVGASLWPGYEPFFQAEELGAFKEKKVRFHRFANNSQILRYYRSGLIQYAACTLGELIRLRADGFRPCVIGVLDFSDGADVLMAASGAPDRPPPGARIAVDHGELGEYLLVRFCETRGIRPENLTRVFLAVNEQESALATGKVDYAITYTPFSARLQALGARTLFSSHDIPGEILDLLVVDEDALRADPQIARALLAGHQRAWAWMRTHPSEAADACARRLGLPASEIWPTYQLIPIPDNAGRAYLTGTPSALETTAHQLAAVMVQQHLIASTPDLSHLVAPDLHHGPEVRP